MVHQLQADSCTSSSTSVLASEPPSKRLVFPFWIDMFLISSSIHFSFNLSWMWERDSSPSTHFFLLQTLLMLHLSMKLFVLVPSLSLSHGIVMNNMPLNCTLDLAPLCRLHLMSRYDQVKISSTTCWSEQFYSRSRNNTPKRIFIGFDITVIFSWHSW